MANNVASATSSGRGSEVNPRMACLRRIIDAMLGCCRASLRCVSWLLLALTWTGVWNRMAGNVSGVLSRLWPLVKKAVSARVLD